MTKLAMNIDSQLSKIVHEFASECSIKSNSYLNIDEFIIGENFEFARQRIHEY